MAKVAIIGGGAGGMLCGIIAARHGHKVSIYEKNDKLGRKLFITGKGRCNLTNACENPEEFLEQMTSNKKFLYRSFYKFTNQDVMDLFVELGVPLKTERGGRVFPVSDRAGDVIGALEKELILQKVSIYRNREVKSLWIEEDWVKGIVFKDGKKEKADRVIVATGGVSYPSTGSTGDGYQFAMDAGHKIISPSPALVPLETKEDFVRELQGLSLKNVRIAVKEGKKEIYKGFGEMLFTHYGISGPLVLSASSFLTKRKKEVPVKLFIDLKPALTVEELDTRIQRDFEKNRKKQFKNGVADLFPSKLIPIMIKLSGIEAERKICNITKEQRLQFARKIKNMTLEIKGTRGFQEAIITKGGVCVKEINPSTMESKLVRGLYFIGEVLDVDALTGGYNLQIAWSSAFAAGSHL
ncbi:NAD(P)/FAD-dependent oxidoreductase [bacterium 1XD42-8]|nr:NAD(P)/FAD-dependent oxidoreductase [bacterium 1XD42-8]